MSAFVMTKKYGRPKPLVVALFYTYRYTLFTVPHVLYSFFSRTVRWTDYVSKNFYDKDETLEYKGL